MDTPATLPELERECGNCQGNGVVTTPGWLQWRQRELAAEAEWRADHPGGAWFPSPECEALAKDEPEPEMACPECSGKGDIVTEAGQEILHFLARHGRERA